MKRAITIIGLIVATLPSVSTADELVLDAEVYEWGQPVKYRFSVAGSYGYFLEVRHRFNWRQTRSYYPPPSTEPLFEQEDGEIDTRTLQVSFDRSRNYYDVVLLSQNALGELEIKARETFLVVRKLPKLPEERVEWSFADNDTLYPGASLRVHVTPPASGSVHENPIIRLIKPGRVLPGGAIEPDQVLHEQPTELGRTLQKKWVSIDPSGHALSVSSQPLRPENSLTLRQNGGGFFEGAWHTRTAGDPLTVVSESAQHEGNKTVLSGYGPLSPIPVGPHVVQILGSGNTVLDERRVNFFPPRQEGAIRIDGEHDEPFSKIPTITIQQRAPAIGAGMLRVAVDRIGRRDTHVSNNGGGAFNLLPNDDGSLAVDLRGPLRSGRYRVSLYFAQQNILLDRREFDYEQPKDDRTLWPAPIEPSIDPEDVRVTIESGDTAVLGEEIRVQVRDENDRLLETGPLIAELYFVGHYTYGCFWREGYYTGSAGLVDDRGIAEFSAPGEPGRYEVRVFRPMNEVPIANYSGGGNIRVTRPHPGSVASPQNMELVGLVGLDVSAPGKADVIRIPEVAMTKPFEVSVSDPGIEFKEHAMAVSLWRSNGRSAGGEVMRPTLWQRGNVSAGGRETQRITGFPFTAKFGRIDEPGDYEIRVQDLTTGFYIARQSFSLRDGPPVLPEFAQYAKTPAGDDLAGNGDPLRGTEAWRLRGNECVDPEFDTPPTLEIVEFWPNDLHSRKDDEYRAAAVVWPGHPYLIQARFKTAPPDDTYRIKIDGERRVIVYRTTDDPRLYRSRLVTFTEQP